MTTFTSFAELATAYQGGGNIGVTPVFDLKKVVMEEETPPPKELTESEVEFLTSEEFGEETRTRGFWAARRIKSLQA
jgi:hypothetical protein